ncbi:MAG TPA: hypothetical protein PLV53_07825 [Anaerolineaceae bacterium]|jgi:hypothetical protein|nr:hypothetical protein [Anaerolineaceae bacterium]
MFKRFMILALAAGLLLAACQPAGGAVVTTPAPTQVTLPVRLDHSAGWLEPLVSACAAQQPQLAVILSENAVEEGGIELRWGQAGTDLPFVAQIGVERLAAVVSRNNTIRQLPLEEFQRVLAGRILYWEELDSTKCIECLRPDATIQPYAYPPEDPLAGQIEAALFPDTRLLPETILVPSTSAMLEAVAADARALGFLPARMIGDRTAELELTDLPDPAVLDFPVLALSASEPAGLARDWLLCVQDGLH